MEIWKTQMLVLLVLFALNANAQFIDYNATNPYVWDSTFSMFGRFTNTNQDQNILCDFFIYDLNGILKKRLTSEYVTVQGTFSSNPIVLKDPPFNRGQDYNAVTVCGSHLSSRQFSIVQRQTLENFLFFEFTWFLEPENVIPFLIVLAIGGFVFLAYQFLRRK